MGALKIKKSALMGVKDSLFADVKDLLPHTAKALLRTDVMGLLLTDVTDLPQLARDFLLIHTTLPNKGAAANKAETANLVVTSVIPPITKITSTYTKSAANDFIYEIENVDGKMGIIKEYQTAKAANQFYPSEEKKETALARNSKDFKSWFKKGQTCYTPPRP